jgi:hypothetical protein
MFLENAGIESNGYTAEQTRQPQLCHKIVNTSLEVRKSDRRENPKLHMT